MSHLCQLRSNSFSHLPKIVPNSPWQTRWRRWIQKLILISIDHPEVQKYLKSKKSVENESRRQVKHFPAFIIHPLSTFRKYWNILIFAMLLLHQMLTPFAIGFFVEMDDFSLDVLIVIDVLACFVLALEVGITFRTGVIVSETHEIILNQRVVARKYLLGDFVPDVISCIPFIYFTTWVIEEHHSGTINGATVVYMIFLFIFSFWRFNRILFYFSSVPIMMNLSEMQAIIMKLCLRSIYW